MRGIDDFEEDESQTVFRDVIFLALAGFVAVVLMLLPHLNPQAKADNDVASPGNVIVEIRWPDELNADVDLWVKAPGDIPVGYSNKGGRVFNLLRDDLGDQADATKLNYEMSYSRGVPSGEYTVNVHLYRNYSRQMPMPVDVMISVKPSPNASAVQILSTSVKLKSEGEELTAFRFSLDEDGKLREGSVHDLPKRLRAKRDFMNNLILLFSVCAVLAAVLANIGIWSDRRLWVKLSAIVIIALFLPVSYGAFAELLSRPKPVNIEWAQRSVPEAVVLGSSMVEDQAIYLWLAFEDQDEPRAYVLPWSEKLARQLHKAQQQADAEGSDVKMRKPFEDDFEQMEKVFYPTPQSAPAAKQVSQEQGPVVFKGTDQGTITND